MLEIAKCGANLVSDRKIVFSPNLGCALADFYGHFSSRDLHMHIWDMTKIELTGYMERQGCPQEALATLRQIKQTDVKYQPAAVITDTTNRETVASTYHGEDKRGDAERAGTKAAAEKERLKEKKAIWDFIHTKSGQQIVQAVKAGTQIGSVSFTDWVNKGCR